MRRRPPLCVIRQHNGQSSLIMHQWATFMIGIMIGIICIIIGIIMGIIGIIICIIMCIIICIIMGIIMCRISVIGIIMVIILGIIMGNIGIVMGMRDTIDKIKKTTRKSLKNHKTKKNQKQI